MKVKTKKARRLLSRWQRLLLLDPDFWTRYKVNLDNKGPQLKE